MTDLAYFLGASLTVEDRRASEQTLVREYFDALVGHGVGGLRFEDCWEGYRRACCLGLLMTIGPAVIVERTDRGDEMFMGSLARFAQQVLDLDALELLRRRGPGARRRYVRRRPMNGRTIRAARSSGTRAGTST